MKTLAIANQKGGTAKTATAHALGAACAAAGLRVLLIDCDPQASLTQAAGAPDCAGRSLAEVLGGAQSGRLLMGDIIRTLAPNLDLAPADLALASAELGLVQRLAGESILKRSLTPLAGRYDLVLIDCPPGLGLLTFNALVAADAVLIPTQPAAVDLRGVRLFLDTLADARELNPALEVLGLVLTFYDARLTHHRQAVEAIQAAGWPILATVPRSVRVAEAASAGQAITQYDPGNPAALAYNQLAEQVTTWRNRKLTP